MVPNAALLGTQQTRGRIWEVTLRWTGVPSKAEHCSQSLHATETGVKHLPYGPFGLVNPVDQRLYFFYQLAVFIYVPGFSLYGWDFLRGLIMQLYAIVPRCYLIATVVRLS